MKRTAVVLSIGLGLAACGGGDAPPVELSIDPPAQPVANLVVLEGTSFVPPGSNCPQTGDFIRIGSLGPHQIGYANVTTAVSGPAFADSWVCNAEDGIRIHWTSNPITLAPGPNTITVTMSAGGRVSSASVRVSGPG